MKSSKFFAGCAVVLAVAAGCSSTSNNNTNDTGAIFWAHYDDVTAGPLPSTNPDTAAAFSQGVKGLPSHTVFSPTGSPENDQLATGGPVQVVDDMTAMETPCVRVDASHDSSWLQWFLDRAQSDPSTFANGQFVVSYTARVESIEQGGSFKTILWGVQKGTGRFGKIGAISMSRGNDNNTCSINFDGAGSDASVNFPINESPNVTVLANVDMGARQVAYKVDMNGITFGPFVVNGFPSNSILDTVGGTPAFATVAMMMDKCTVDLDDMAVIQH